MKRILTFVIAAFICSNLISQTAPLFQFRKPVTNGSNSWKFNSVIPGVNAIVTVIGSQNATLSRIDDSSSYPLAWQPFIRITNATSQNTDSSYLIFKVEFQDSNGTPSTQSKVAMTIIDLDGSSSLKEFIRVSLPSTSFNTLSTTITQWTDSRWLNSVSGSTNFSTIDTSTYDAMSQINLTNISTYTMRVGVVGSISAGSVRQSSYYFKPFKTMVVALPVTLSHFDTKLVNSNSELNWSTVETKNLNRFEVCRSTDGINFTTIGNVHTVSSTNESIQYNYTDNNVSAINAPVVYYRLKMIENNGSFQLSNISMVKLNAAGSVINVFPNPTTNFVNVTLNSEVETTQIQIVDSYGRILQNEMNASNLLNNIQFDVRNFENGIYFINIVNIDGTITSSKFIKR